LSEENERLTTEHSNMVTTLDTAERKIADERKSLKVEGWEPLKSLCYLIVSTDSYRCLRILSEKEKRSNDYRNFQTIGCLKSSFETKKIRN
jgi:hypothetical protein